MADVNRVYFPLKSNVGWFQSYNLQNEMTNHIKESILIYDELCIEDGTYMANVLDDGGRFSTWLPPGILPEEQRIVEFKIDLKPDTMMVAMGPDGQMPTDVVLHGMSSVRFKIDYYSIFKGLDISSYDFFKPVIVHDLDLPPEAKQLIQRNTFTDKTRFSDLEVDTFLRDLVIENLNYDLVASILLNANIVLDAKHGDLLRRKVKIPAKPGQLDQLEEAVVVRHLLEVAAPDFSEMPLEQVIELREHRLWKDFRGFISELLSNIKTDPDVLIDGKAFEEAVRKKVTLAFFEEAKRKHPTGLNLSMDLGLGITGQIPGLSLISGGLSAAKSIYQHFSSKSGWYAFLLKLDRRK